MKKKNKKTELERVCHLKLVFKAEIKNVIFHVKKPTMIFALDFKKYRI